MVIRFNQAALAKAVKYLLRWKKQLVCGLIILGFFLLLMLINRITPNSSAWLQGHWENQSAKYSFKAQNEDFTSWTIKCKGASTVKRVRVTVNSNRKKVIMTDDGNTIEYQAVRTGSKELSLKIIKNGKVADTVKLKKIVE